MHVSIHSIKETLFDGEAVSLTCPTTSGEITILDHHRPIITVLQKGTLTVTDSAGRVTTVDTVGGVVEVHDNSVRVIT